MAFPILLRPFILASPNASSALLFSPSITVCELRPWIFLREEQRFKFCHLELSFSENFPVGEGAATLQPYPKRGDVTTSRFF